MDKVTRYSLGMPEQDFEREGLRQLRVLQDSLLPEHAKEIVAINVETGEYVLGAKSRDVTVEFRRRWPGKLAYIVRVDGGPVVKFHDCFVSCLHARLANV